MSERDPKPVMVAVGNDPIDSALAFAVGEATRAGCGLTLLHVMPFVHQAFESKLVTGTDFERLGHQKLEAVAARVREGVGADVPISCELRVGGVVQSLVDMAADARMIVLERRGLSATKRLFTHSISSGVAAHAHIPVVSVPAHWSPPEGQTDVPTVMVGVDVPERAELVLRAGIAEAKSRGALLRVLHVWSLPDAYDDLFVTPREDLEWDARWTGLIQESIDALGDAVEDVHIQIDACHADEADALIKASRGSEVLVIGRHDSRIPIGSHLGPIARAVLRGAECPVLLTDPRPSGFWNRHAHRTADAVTQPA